MTALCEIVRCVRYLWWELEHGSAHDERSRVMLCSQSQCVCAIKSPQTPVSQNRLCADDDLNNTHGNKRFQHSSRHKCLCVTNRKQNNTVLSMWGHFEAIRIIVISWILCWCINPLFHLIDSWHYSENGSVWDDRCLDVLFGKNCGHFMPLMDGKEFMWV